MPRHIEMVFTRDPAAAARSGQADLPALACDTEDLSGLEHPGHRHPSDRSRSLPVQHPLAAGRSLSLRRLRAEATFAEQGPALSLDEIIDSVALDRLIVIVGEGAAARTGPAVPPACRLTGLAPSTLVLAWPATSSPRPVPSSPPPAATSPALARTRWPQSRHPDDRPATAADRYRARHQPHGNRAAIGRGDGDHAHRRPVLAVELTLDWR